MKSINIDKIKKIMSLNRGYYNFISIPIPIDGYGNISRATGHGSLTYFPEHGDYTLHLWVENERGRVYRPLGDFWVYIKPGVSIKEECQYDWHSDDTVYRNLIPQTVSIPDGFTRDDELWIKKLIGVLYEEEG